MKRRQIFTNKMEVGEKELEHFLIIKKEIESQLEDEIKRNGFTPISEIFFECRSHSNGKYIVCATCHAGREETKEERLQDISRKIKDLEVMRQSIMRLDK